jgi:flagellar basal-body rod modification protein FlgD
MTVESTTGAAAAGAGSTSVSGHSVLGKEQFLHLLVTQLRNQDPLNPMQSHEFVAQLAQFTSVEQLITMNESMATQSAMSGLLAQSLNSGVAAGLIGRSITASGQILALQPQGDAPVRFELPSGAATVKISIRDAAGHLVRVLEAKDLPAGHHDLPWDGAGPDGRRLPAGTYTFEIEAADADGDLLVASPRIRGVVDRVTFGQDGIKLWIGTVPVPMQDVQSVEARS